MKNSKREKGGDLCELTVGKQPCDLVGEATAFLLVALPRDIWLWHIPRFNTQKFRITEMSREAMHSLENIHNRNLAGSCIHIYRLPSM